MKKAGTTVDYFDRHDDRGPPRRPDGRQDRRGGRVLLVRHQRPDADDLRLQPGRHPGVHADLPQGEDPPGRPVPVARHQRRRPAHRDGGHQGAARPARRRRASISRSASAASTAATPTASPSATRWAWTTSRAPPSASRSPASPPRRPPSPTGRPSAAIARRAFVVRVFREPRPADRRKRIGRTDFSRTSGGRRSINSRTTRTTRRLRRRLPDTPREQWVGSDN